MLISNVQNAVINNTTKIGTDINFKPGQDRTTAVEPVQRVDAFEKEGAVSESVTYEPPKKLTTEQVEEIQRQRMEAMANLVKDTVMQYATNQTGYNTVLHSTFQIDEKSSDLLTEIFGSLEAALPTPATTPEGALADISEGGAYSIEAVSERIMLMATSIAGDNPETLKEMQEAVIKGFEAAGLDTETGDGMPDITMDTYEHVMNEFDVLLNPATDEENQ